MEDFTYKERDFVSEISRLYMIDMEVGLINDK